MEHTGNRIGEAWLCADLEETSAWGAGGQSMVSVVCGGWGLGRTLHEQVAAFGMDILGQATDRFPLLLKVLDAERPLSIQVHPSRQYAARNPSAYLKSEAWLSLQAREDALFFVGTRERLTAERFADVVRGGDLVSALDAVKATPGDAVLIPSGTVHALGAGNVVFEVQTASDTTFRLYDWSLETGILSRPLHITEALEACDLDLAPTWHRAADHPVGGVIFSTSEFDLRSMSPGRHELGPLASSGAMVIFPRSSGAVLTTARGAYSLPRCRATVVPVALMRTAWINVSGDEGVLAVTVR